jgi:hypothetical protein
MTGPRETLSLSDLPWTTLIGCVLSGLFLMTASYPPLALGSLIALFFAVYVWMRVMIYLENDRFSPKRIRVGATWALIGVHDEVNEFDARPVRVYFILLAILFVGLVVRPLLEWIWL